MARLIPGYSFGTNEIPIRATLQQMLNGMSVAAISASLINTSLAGINFGTSGTTLPDEGWIWADVTGDLWVRTTNGSCKLWRANYGWSSNRWPTWGSQDTITLPRSPSDARAFLKNRLGSGDGGESNIGWFTSADVTTAPLGRAEDTCVSGVFTRWIMRGNAHFHISGGSGRGAMIGAVHRSAGAGVATMADDPIPPSNTQGTNNVHFGLTGKQLFTDSAMGWLFGAAIKYK